MLDGDRSCKNKTKVKGCKITDAYLEWVVSNEPWLNDLKWLTWSNVAIWWGEAF